LQQVLPRGKDQEGGDGREIVEELAAGADLLPGTPTKSIKCQNENCWPADEEARQAICPWRGLDAFREEDSAFFFGCGCADEPESPIGQLLRKVREHSFVMVVGRSGSGKSSLVFVVRLLPDGTATKVGVFVRLSGGLAGPDGLALNEEEGLTIAHAGYGVVWICNRWECNALGCIVD
jgi:hypothetical protein